MDKNTYRVWDKEDKRMITDSQEFVPLIVTSKGLLRLSAEHEDDLYTLIPFGDRFVSMRCTGLTDKNGNYIFIGDYVWCDPAGFSAEVVDDYTALDTLESRCLRSEWEVSVIGNIYEDTE